MLRLVVWPLSAAMVFAATSASAEFRPCKRPFIFMNKAKATGRDMRPVER